MHFSKSAALAATSIYAGVASADCSTTPPPMSNYGLGECTKAAGADIWHCGAGAGVTRVKGTNTFLVYSGTGGAGIDGIQVSCGYDDPSPSSTYCGPKSWGSVSRTCPSNSYLVMSISVVSDGGSGGPGVHQKRRTD
ncbi:hypothetical protein E4U54_008842 [Claviceps lovelessii]|nr:hypothetical protein E4U54_008842 [Claviceps lovelessii]